MIRKKRKHLFQLNILLFFGFLIVLLIIHFSINFLFSVNQGLLDGILSYIFVTNAVRIIHFSIHTIFVTKPRFIVEYHDLRLGILMVKYRTSLNMNQQTVIKIVVN